MWPNFWPQSKFPSATSVVGSDVSEKNSLMISKHAERVHNDFTNVVNMFVHIRPDFNTATEVILRIPKMSSYRIFRFYTHTSDVDTKWTYTSLTSNGYKIQQFLNSYLAPFDFDVAIEAR
jgi:hypothetical protein